MNHSRADRFWHSESDLLAEDGRPTISVQWASISGLSIEHSAGSFSVVAIRTYRSNHRQYSTDCCNSTRI
jgi:hypothetical protein